MVAYSLEAGEDRLVTAAPAILDAIVVCERTGADPVAVDVVGAGNQGPYMTIRLAAGGVLAATALAAGAPWGLKVVLLYGEGHVTVTYR
jgi:hypothetical protein